MVFKLVYKYDLDEAKDIICRNFLRDHVMNRPEFFVPAYQIAHDHHLQGSVIFSNSIIKNEDNGDAKQCVSLQTAT